jgi:hypothetical protein
LLDKFLIVHGGEATDEDGKHVSMDDLYALDLETRQWLRLSQALGPLGCFGHSMNIVKLKMSAESVDCVLVFGGYSTQLNSCSNNVYVCEVSDVLRSIKTCITERKGELPRDGFSVRWRTLKLAGKPPPPRYRYLLGPFFYHSCGDNQICRHSGCVIPTQQNNAQLIIFGGIFANFANQSKPPKPLNDLYILDLQKLSWVIPTSGNDALADGIHLNGPTAIFGHVAIPMKAVITNIELTSKSIDLNAGRYDMLVYGGSTCVHKPETGCQHGLYQFNTAQHTWTKANTGFLFPPERSGHSVSICYGWSPFYNYPEKKFSVATAVKSEENALGASDRAVDTLRSCAVVFSGLSSLQRQQDLWCLDLTPGRRSGVNQFDYCVSNLIEHSYPNTRSMNQALLTLRKPAVNTMSKYPNSPSPVKMSAATYRAMLEDIDANELPPLLRISPVPLALKWKISQGCRLEIGPSVESVSSVLAGFQGLQRLGGSRNPSSRVNTQRSHYSLQLIPEEQNVTDGAGENEQSCYFGDNDTEYWTDGNDDAELLRSNSNLSSVSLESVRVLHDPQDELELLGGNSYPSNRLSSRPSAPDILIQNIGAGQQSPSQSRGSTAYGSINRKSGSPTNGRPPERRTITKQPSGLRKVQTPKPRQVVEKEEIGSAYLKSRIQRAVADMNTELERGQALTLEGRCGQLESEVCELKTLLEAQRESKALEESILNQALEASREKIRQLGLVNLEAARLARLVTS